LSSFGASENSLISLNKEGIEAVVEEAKTLLAENSKITLSFTHFSNTQFINNRLEESLLYLESSLRKAQIDDRVGIEFDIITEENFNKVNDALESELLSDGELKVILKEYEVRQNVQLQKEIKGRISKYLSLSSIGKRLNKVKNKFFGTPQGYTFIDFLKSSSDNSKKLKKEKAAKSIKFALRTSLLATASFTLGTTEALSMFNIPFFADWNGVMKLMSPEHLTSSAAIGVWVYVFMRYVEKVVKIKTQGRSLVKKVYGVKQKIEFKTNKILYNTSSIVQELVGTTLITAAMMGVSNLMNAGAEVWLSVIASNAILSALSYAPAESYAARFFQDADVYMKEADQLKKQGKFAEAERLITKAKAKSKSASRVLDIWWNLIFPACKWTGVAMTLGAAGDEAAKLSTWFIANSGLLTFASFGVLQDLYQNRFKVLYKGKRWLGLYKPDTKAYCSTHLSIQSSIQP